MSRSSRPSDYSYRISYTAPTTPTTNLHLSLPFRCACRPLLLRRLASAIAPVHRPPCVLHVLDNPGRLLLVLVPRGRRSARKAQVRHGGGGAGMGPACRRAGADSAAGPGHLGRLRVHVRHRDCIGTISRLEHAEAAAAGQRRAGRPGGAVAWRSDQNEGALICPGRACWQHLLPSWNHMYIGRPHARVIVPKRGRSTLRCPLFSHKSRGFGIQRPRD